MRNRMPVMLLGLALGFLAWLGRTDGAGAALGGESSHPTLVHGSATISQNGSNWNVNANSNKTVINWQTFGVPQGSVTNFNLPKPSSMVLNRVTGGLSTGIYGQLNSNGKVFLVNPNGIVIGPSGVINTRSFAATTLDVDNAAFLATGKLRFSGATDATVVNLGTIEADGGDVLLLAPQVENHGSIVAQDGAVALVAARDVLLTKNHQVYIQPAQKEGPGTGTGVLNTGRIEALRAELLAQGNLYALAINNEGTVHATGAVQEGGKVLLRADGGLIRNSGTLAAQTQGKGDSSVGGQIQVLGETIALEGEAQLLASGDHGGGQINVGGSFQGSGPLPNAEQVFTGAHVKIQADALKSGDGGTVILWANELNRYYGQISAQGGPLGGNGGFAEVSGKTLVYRGQADLRAPNGKIGTLLLDPVDGTIKQGSGDGDLVTPDGNAYFEGNVNLVGGQILDDGAGGGSDDTAPVDIFESELEAMLSAGNVIIQMTNNLTIEDLSANGGDGILGAAGATGTLTLSADSDNAGGGAFTMNNTANTIRTDGDTVTIHGDSVVLGKIDTTGSGGATANGAIIIQAGGGGISLNGDLKTLGAGGDVTLTSLGAVTQNAGVISGDLLTLDHSTGSGDFTLNQNNLVASLAVTGAFDGNLQVTNNQNLSVGAISTSNNKNITLKTATGTLSIAGDLNVGTSTTAGQSTVTLDSAGTVSQGAGDTITANRLDLKGAGPFNLATNNNPVAILGSTATGNIAFAANAALALQNTSGNFTGGDITITHDGGALTIGTDLALTGLFSESQSGNGAVNLNADIVSTGAGKTITFNEAILLGADATLATNNANITLTAITTSAADTNTLTVDAGSGTIGIGADIGASGTKLAGINLKTTAALNVANDLFANGRIILDAAGASTGAGDVVTAGSLLLQGAGTFTLTTDIGTLAANTSGGVVTITENNALTIGTVANLVPANVNGINTGGQNIELITGNSGQITLTQGITASGAKVILKPDGGQTGTGTVTATQLLLQGKGPFDLTTAVTDLAAGTTTGSIKVSDADGLTVTTVQDSSAANVTGITSGNQNVELVTAGSGLLTLTQGINAGTGKVILNPDGGQTGTGTVTASQLLLLGKGAFDLNTTITTLAAATTLGGIKITESNGLTIGSVQDSASTTFNGIDSTNQNIELKTTAGAITLNQDVNAGSAKLILNAAAGASGAGSVAAAQLLILGAGGYDLSTDVGSLAVDTTSGNIKINENDALTITTVQDSSAGNHLGVVAGGAANVELITNNLGLLTLTQGITASGDKVILAPTGGQTGTGLVTATDLVLLGGGGYDLTTTVGNIAANTSGGNIKVTETDSLTVTTLTDSSAANVVGITANNTGSVELITLGAVGTITLTQGITATGDKVILNPFGGASGNGDITATDLVLKGTGPFTLDTVVTNLAANISGGPLTINENDSLTLTTLDAINGITSGNQDVILNLANAGALAIQQQLNAGTGQATLNTTGSAATSGAGLVTAAGLTLQGNSGDFNLATSVDNLESSNLGNGSVIITNNKTLNVGGISGNVGITASGGIDLTTTGVGSNLVLSENLNATAGTGNLDLKWTGQLSGAGTLTGNTLRLEGPTGGAALNVNVATVTNIATKGAGITGVDGVTITGSGFTTQTINVNGNALTFAQGASNFNLGAGTITAASISETGTGNLVVTGNSILDTSAANGTISLQELITLQADLTLNAGTGAINLTNVDTDVVGSHTLALTAGADVSFTINQRIDTLTINNGKNADVTLSGSLLADNINVASTHANANLIVAADFSADSMSLTSEKNVQLDGNITITNGGALTIKSASATQNATKAISTASLILETKSGTGNFTIDSATNNIAAVSTQDSDANSVQVAGNITIVSAAATTTLGPITTSNAGDLSITHGANNLVIGGAVNLAGNFIENGTGVVTLANTLTVGANNNIAFGGTLKVDASAQLTTSGSGTITLNDVIQNNGNDSLTLQTGNGLITLNGDIGVAGTPLQQLTLITNNGVSQAAGKTIHAGTLQLQGNGSFTLVSNVDNANTSGNVGGAITLTNGKALTINGTGLSATGNIGLTTSAGGLTFSQALTSAGDVTLNSAAGTGGAGKVTGDDLFLQGGGAFGLSTSVNTLATGSLANGSSVTVSNDKALAVGNVTANAGISLTNTAGAGITLSGALDAGASTIGLIWNGTVTQNAGATFTAGLLNLQGNNGGTTSLTVTGVGNIGTTGGGISGGGNVILTSGGALGFNTFNAGANKVKVNTAGATTNAGATLTADQLQLTGSGPANLSTSVNTLAANLGGNSLTINNNKALSIGTVSTDVSTSGVTATGIRLTTTVGGISLDQAVDCNAGGLTLATAGGVTQGASGQIIDTSTVTLSGSGTFTLTNGGNAFSGLLSSGALGGSVTALTTQTLNIGNLNAGANNVTLTAAGTTAGGTLTAGTLSVSGSGTFTLGTTVDNLTAGVTGSITINESNGLNIAAGGLTANGAGNTVTLNTASGSIGGSGTVSAANLVLQGSGSSYTLNTSVDNISGSVSGGGQVNISNGAKALAVNNLAVAGGTVHLTAAGVTGNGLSAGSLLLDGNGAHTLSGTVGTLAAKTTGGAFSFTNSTGLTIGTVLGINGIDTGGRDLALTVGGLLTSSQNIAVGAGTATLDVAGMEQSGSGVSGAGLLLKGTGTFNLIGTNSVQTLAANVNGALAYSDQDGLQIGSVGGTDGIRTGANSLFLAAGGLVELLTVIDIQEGSMTLNVGQIGVTQADTGGIRAGQLLIQGTGEFALDRPGNTIHELAADFAGGSINLLTSGNLTVTTLNGIVGVTAQDGNVTLAAPNGFIVVEAPIAANGPKTENKNITVKGDVRPRDTVLSQISGTGNTTLIGKDNGLKDILGQTHENAAATPGASSSLENSDLLGDALSNLGDLSADSLAGAEEWELKWPKELVKAQETLDEIFKRGFDDQFLLLTNKQIQRSMQGVEKADQVLVQASPVFHALPDGSPLKELLREQIVQLKLARRGVREASQLLSKLLKRLYLDKMRDLVNQDAFKGSINGLLLANERINVTAPVLRASVETALQGQNAQDQAALASLARTASERAGQEAEQENQRARERLDRVYTDVLIFDFDE